jgi:hypothetical protein
MTRCTSFQYLPERVFTQTSLAVVAGAVFETQHRTLGRKTGNVVSGFQIPNSKGVVI